ncbi:MAG: amidohydrolase [Actinomycetota bacterium]|nr:amidohydrolase [Actinomycetota bacterium]
MSRPTRDSSGTTVYAARAVHTLDPARATAEAVAVRDGRFLAVGDPDDLVATYDGTLDTTLSDKVLLPGFVEAHSHKDTGGLWQYTYVGYEARTDPDGRSWPGCTTFEAVVERLREADRLLDDPNEPLLAWGLDPIFWSGERLDRRQLDAVSTTRRIFVAHSNMHLATVNSALMEAEGITPDTVAEGVPKDASGWPLGELQEFPAMALAGAAFRSFFGRQRSDEAIHLYGQAARNVGVTTLTDLGTSNLLDEAIVRQWLGIVDHGYPMRVAMFHGAMENGAVSDEDCAATLVDLKKQSTDHLRFGQVKLLLDGSIQGGTARLRWPGFQHGGPNGIWLIPPDQFARRLAPYHRAGLQVHTHANGDEAVDVLLDAFDEVQTAYPIPDHRHTVQHCQLTSPGQYQRMKALGMCANIFSNHTWFWGDQHILITVGPDRAARMNAARTALDLGVPLSMHSDSPVTPLGSLHVAWAAVNRLTPSGVVVGPDERITVAEALHAVTVGAAWQLRMEDEVGSISPRKFADLAILEADPFEVDPVELRDVPVWGTMCGGVLHQGA